MTTPARTVSTGTAAPDPAAGRGPTWLDEFLEQQLPALFQIRRQIHMHPELSRAEHRTTDLVQRTLADAGIVGTRLAGGTGLVADIGGEGGPFIALRADMDALPLTQDAGVAYPSAVPGVAHACGHDMHTAVVLGAALALAAAPERPCRVRLIFQPAEEVLPSGAQDVVDAGALAGVDYAYAVHCDPSLAVGLVGTRVGPITASCDTVAITVTGPGGHTSRPHLTVDVVGALAALAADLPALVARHLPTQAGVTLVWGAIEAGGTAAAPNVIPRTGEVRGTLRLADRAAWDGSESLVRQLAGAILAPYGAEFEIQYVRGVPPTVNDPRAVATARAAIAAALGAASLVESPQSSGGEDFAVMLGTVPGALLRLGVWDGVSARVDLHSATFQADERALPIGIRTLVHAVLGTRAGTGGFPLR